MYYKLVIVLTNLIYDAENHYRHTYMYTVVDFLFLPVLTVHLHVIA